MALGLDCVWAIKRSLIVRVLNFDSILVFLCTFYWLTGSVAGAATGRQFPPLHWHGGLGPSSGQACLPWPVHTS